MSGHRYYHAWRPVPDNPAHEEGLAWCLCGWNLSIPDTFSAEFELAAAFVDHLRGEPAAQVVG